MQSGACSVVKLWVQWLLSSLLIFTKSLPRVVALSVYGNDGQNVPS